MRRLTFVVLFALLGLALGSRQLLADPEPAEAEPEHHEAAPAAAAEHHETPEHHDAVQEAAVEAELDHEEAAAVQEAEREVAADPDADEEDLVEAKISMFDLDGDGKDDPSLKQEYGAAFAGVPTEINTDEVDQELAARPAASDLLPSMTVEQFRAAVQMAKKVVLAKMEKKMARGAAKKLAQFSCGIFIFSLLGFLLLAIPVVMRKRYPGQGKVLVKYSALAAVTFFLMVNLFGGVLLGMRTVQGALGNLTNPTLAIASGTFETLDRHAEEYTTMGKELFAPTLKALRGTSDEQPVVVLLENGQKIVKDAKVFVSVAKMFKKVDFVFEMLPVVLFAVTMILFGLAIRPTLTQIIKLPMRAAAGEGGVGAEVARLAMRRVWGELLATMCTIGVLVGLTLISAFVLGEIVTPALHALLSYFSRAVSYLQFVEGASSGLVFLTLFGVILFLVLNLASLILSMAFYLGKSQKIFQQRFNEGVPVRAHARFFQWGTLAVVFVQIFPWLFAVVADKILGAINASILDVGPDASKVSWTKLMLVGPLFLVVGFVLVFWAVRGVKAIKFLQGYKVTAAPVPQRPAPSVPAEAV